jgi:hypothetical protein
MYLPNDQEAGMRRDMDKDSGNLPTEATARYVGPATSIWAKMRVRGGGPPYRKAGSRVVVYDVREPDAWLRNIRRESTRSKPVMAEV